MKRELWIYCETCDNAILSDSLALLAHAACQWSQQMTVAAVFIGNVTEHAVEMLFAAGADRVYGCCHHGFVSERQAALSFQDLVFQYRPAIFIFSATDTGRSIAAQTAALLGTGLTAGCTGLSLQDNGLLLQTRPAYEGSLLATILCPHKEPQMATVSRGVFSKPVLQAFRTGEFIPFTIHECRCGMQIIRRTHFPRASSLANAEIVVAGGAGIGSSDNFQMLERFASEIGAVAGSSRGAVNAGYASPDCQIGQTGQTIRPKLYIAFAISGAVQHLSGIAGSGFIIAVNKDRNAPILSHADLALICDWRDGLDSISSYYRKLCQTS